MKALLLSFIFHLLAFIYTEFAPWLNPGLHAGPPGACFAPSGDWESGLGRPALALPLRLIHPTMGGKEPSPMGEPVPIFDIVIAAPPHLRHPSPARARPAWRWRPRSSRRWGAAFRSPSSIRRPRRRQRCAAAHGRDRRGAAAPPRAHRRLGGDRTQGASHRFHGHHGRGRGRRRAPPAPQFREQRHGRSPIWRSTTMSWARSRRSAIGSGFSASRRRSRIGPRASASLSSGSPTEARCARASRSLPTGRARS